MFLNAAFGNLPELMFGLIALSKGLGPLVKAAWTGSILGNLFLVLALVHEPGLTPAPASAQALR